MKFSDITTWIKDMIAKVGVNPYFIAFNAHCWFAFAVMTFLPYWPTLFVGFVLAGVKEFYFDANFERPHQTFFDNLTDFLGYAAGLLIGAAWGGLF